MPFIRLLGAVGAESDGSPLELGAARQRAALACLALSHPRPSSVESITRSLWGEDPTTSSRNAIQVYVSGLRKALRTYESDIIRSGDGYALRGTDLIVDVTRFDELVAEGRAALRSGDLIRAAAALEHGLQMWAGAPLDGLGDLPFVDTARRQLESTKGVALSELADCYLRLGRPDDAVRASRQLLDGHPYDERGWALLVTAHYAAGRQAEALQEYSRARDLLATDLGVDPSPELADLERRILQHDMDRPPDLPGDDEPALAAALPELPADFVGREAMVDEIVGVVTGGHRLTTLTGMGGIGKTSIAIAAAIRLAADGLRVRFISLEADNDAAAALDRVGRALGVDPGEDSVQSLADRLDDLVDVLVIDNVEQVSGMADAVTKLLQHTRSARLVLTSRLPLRVRREQVLVVPPLEVVSTSDGPSPAVRLFLAAAARVGRTSERTTPTDQVEQLCSVLGGIPLAIELVAARARVLTTRQMLDRLRASSSALESRLPGLVERQATMTRVIDATYDMVAGAAQSVLRLLAEFDGPVPLEYLEAHVGEPAGPDLLDRIDDLVACGLTLAEDGHLVVQAPVRDVIRRRPGRDRFARAAVASAVEFALAGPPDISGLEAAGELRRLGSAHDLLVSALHRCIENRWTADASALAIRLHRYWLLTGRIVEGRRWLEVVRELPAAEEPAATRVALLAGCFASYVNDASAITSLTAALTAPAVDELPRDRILVNAWCCLAAVLAHHDRISEAQDAADHAVARAAESGSPGLVALARDLTGHVAAYAGDHARSLAATLGGLADARRTGDDFDVVQLLCGAVDSLMALGRYSEAVTFADEAFDRAAQLEVGHLLPSVLISRGMAHTVSGNLAVATGDLVETLRVTRDRFPDPLFAADALYLLAHGAVVRGDVELAPRIFGAAEALYEDQGIAPGARTGPDLLKARESFRIELGGDIFDSAAVLGRADPARVIERLTNAAG